MHTLPYTRMRRGDQMSCTLDPSTDTSLHLPNGKQISITHSEIFPSARKKRCISNDESVEDTEKYSAMIKEDFRSREDFRFFSEDPTTMKEIREQLRATANKRQSSIKAARKQVKDTLAHSLSFSQANESIMSAWAASIPGGKLHYTNTEPGTECTVPLNSALHSSANIETVISIEGGTVSAGLELLSNGTGRYSYVLRPLEKDAKITLGDSLRTALNDWEDSENKTTFSMTGGVSDKNHRLVEKVLAEKQEELRRCLTESNVIEELSDTEELFARIRRRGGKGEFQGLHGPPPRVDPCAIRKGA